MTTPLGFSFIHFKSVTVISTKYWGWGFFCLHFINKEQSQKISQGGFECMDVRV